MGQPNWLAAVFLLLAGAPCLAATKDTERADREMLRMMEFLREMEMLKQMEMMREMQEVEQSSDPLPSPPPPKSSSVKKKEPVK
jgi:hypothetical protein